MLSRARKKLRALYALCASGGVSVRLAFTSARRYFRGIPPSCQSRRGYRSPGYMLPPDGRGYDKQGGYIKPHIDGTFTFLLRPKPTGIFNCSPRVTPPGYLRSRVCRMRDLHLGRLVIYYPHAIDYVHCRPLRATSVARLCDVSLDVWEKPKTQVLKSFETLVRAARHLFRHPCLRNGVLKAARPFENP